MGIDAETRAILNIEQDHLDFHKNIQNYIDSKLKILDFSSQNKIILNGDCETSASLIDKEMYLIHISEPTRLRRGWYCRGGV